MLRILLFPFAILYNLVTRIRNYLYDTGRKPSARFDLPVISVGNLTVGGTGKTPLIEHLIRILHPQYAIATLSRGYGRQTKGFRLAQPSDSAATLGDEPYQFYKKFGDQVVVAVGEDRAFAIPNILQEHTGTEVILLDDAFQHRRVNPSLNILLSDYHRPFYKDLVLPAGRLRESRTGARRADVVIITKCPVEISDDEIIEIGKLVRRYTQKPVFFTTIHYGNPVSFGAPGGTLQDRVILLTGIANAKPLKDYVSQNFKIVSHLELKDHHQYTASDLDNLRQLIGENPGTSILTTEKDRVKLEAPEFKTVTAQLPLFYLPIEVEFIKNGKDFDEIVLNSVRRGV